MATREIIEWIDDLDGQDITGASETIRFGLDGIGYEIDLGPRNAQALRDALQPYVAKGRRVAGQRTATPKAGRTRVDPEQLAAARRWLRSRGHEVSDRGRIKGELMDLYMSNAGAQ